MGVNSYTNRYLCKNVKFTSTCSMQKINLKKTAVFFCESMMQKAVKVYGCFPQFDHDIIILYHLTMHHIFTDFILRAHIFFCSAKQQKTQTQAHRINANYFVYKSQCS